MNDPHVSAMFWISTMSERDRRTTEESAGRMFAGIVGAVRRLRGVRPVREPRAVRPQVALSFKARPQTETR
jgi:hypothetical protein